jgi:hypothetical protein
MFKQKKLPENIKETQLSKLADDLLSDIDHSLFDKDFVEQEWKKEKLRKIAAKITIKNNIPYFDAPYGHHHGRYADLKYLFLQTCRQYELPDCSFIVILNDAHAAQFPVFSAIRRIKKDIYNIPLPMGNIRGMGDDNHTPLMGWNEHAQAEITDTHQHYSWKNKKNIAVFRGQYSHQTWKLGKYTEEKAESWTEVNRGVLYKTAENHKDLFDVGFNVVGSNPFKEDIPSKDPIPFTDQQRYKYMICVGTNANWAERLRNHLFTNSVLVKHEAECMEWFYYLIKPFEHYVPFNLMMTDLVDNIKWAKANDQECQNIVKNANQFAKEYLNEETMFLFTKILIEKYNIIIK